MMISSVFALAISHSIRSTGFPGIIFSGINRLIGPRKAYGSLRKAMEGYGSLRKVIGQSGSVPHKSHIVARYSCTRTKSG